MEKRWMKILFYFVVIILVFYAIFPFTRFYYTKPIFVPFFSRLNEDDLVLAKGEHKRIYPFGHHKEVTYSSMDFKIASVWITGRVNAYRVGTTVINVKVDGKLRKCRVTVIDLKESSVTIEKGEKKQIVILGTDAFADYESEDTLVASVDEDGVIRGKKEGNTTILVKVRGKTLKCSVKVE